MDSVAVDRDVAAAVAGSSEAWDGIVTANVESMWKCALGVGLSGADAAQVCELAWLRLGQHLHTFGSLEDVSAWLEALVLRESVALSAHRRRAPVPANVVPLTPGFGAGRADAARHTVSVRQLISPAHRPGDPSPVQI